MRAPIVHANISCEKIGTLNLPKLRAPIVHAKLIFLYFKNAAEQTPMGVRRLPHGSSSPWADWPRREAKGGRVASSRRFLRYILRYIPVLDFADTYHTLIS